MTDKPKHDQELQEMLSSFEVDGTTIARSFFDELGVLSYPWRAQVEKIGGKEKHTIRLEARSWRFSSKRMLAAIRYLSRWDLELARETDGSHATDWHLLAEVHHEHLMRTGRVSVDRLAAVLAAAAVMVGRWKFDTDNHAAAECLFEELLSANMPIDGVSLEAAGAECIGLAWGLYEVPESWSDDDVNRSQNVRSI